MLSRSVAKLFRQRLAHLLINETSANEVDSDCVLWDECDRVGFHGGAKISRRPSPGPTGVFGLSPTTMSAKGHRIVKRDFVDPDEHCAYCKRSPGRRLKAGIAYFLVDKSGRERPCGPTCVKSADNWGERVFDLTAAAAAPTANDAPKRDDEPTDETEDSEGPEPPEPPDRTRGWSDAEIARRYLFLRCEALKQHTYAVSVDATGLWDRVRRGDVRFVMSALELIDDDARREPRLTLANLEDCYAFDRLLQLAMGRPNVGTEKTVALLKSFLSQLRRYGRLSPKQVAIVSDVCKRCRLPTVRATAFDWWVPPVVTGALL